MLTVDRHKLAAAVGAGRMHEMARHHECFLVGERDALAPFERGQRCVEAGRSNDGIDHDIDVVAGRGGNETVPAALPCTMISRAVVHEANESGMKLRFLLPQQGSVIERRKR